MAQKSVPTLDDLRAKRHQILDVMQHYGADNVRVVGSVARNEAGIDSDVDLLVALPPTSVFDLVGLWLDLREILGYEVSIIPESTDDTAFMAAIYEDAVPL